MAKLEAEVADLLEKAADIIFTQQSRVGRRPGGRLFHMEYTENTELLRQNCIKFEQNGDKIVVFSRNVWSQGTIPPKHRHFWTINAKILPEKPILRDFNGELSQNAPKSPEKQ
jgi:hypothetical protein